VIYRLLFRLFLQRLDPEAAHALASRTLRAVLALPGVGTAIRGFLAPKQALLEVRALGVTFPSPLGVAAGVDKDASWFEGLGALGFGFVEVGTVTAVSQDGNPRPRVLRLTRERALLNRMGSPNPGARVVAERLRRRTGGTIVGVNVGRSMAAAEERTGEDYRAAVRELAPHADYLVINVSSPNTPGLRELQAVDRLRPLVGEVRSGLEEAGLRVPILVKIGPDLRDDQIDEVADLALTLGLDGIVAVNTTVDRGGLVGPSAEATLFDGGGISGGPLKVRALEVLERLYTRVGGELVLISVGGIETPADAWERIRAGATLVQAHTGFIYGGPAWPRRINRGLASHLRDAGWPSIERAVGTGARGRPSSTVRA
jgi:dihydroorotate dehydrogenase